MINQPILVFMQKLSALLKINIYAFFTQYFFNRELQNSAIHIITCIQLKKMRSQKFNFSFFFFIINEFGSPPPKKNGYKTRIL